MPPAAPQGDCYASRASLYENKFHSGESTSPARNEATDYKEVVI